MSASESVAAVQLHSVTKRFGDVVAVDSVELSIAEGEFFSLLGPSGCGKTTTLRMLGGFEYPDEGAVFLRGEDVTYVPPNKRATNMVFQNYELFPHFTAYENISYGLKISKIPKAELAQRTKEIMDVVSISELADRKAAELSGGQRQRVALARALVNRPAVLLLDEPLSALDVRLRKRMQSELKAIQHRLGTTFVYVTHDQEEALGMSDRIGIMNEGQLLQVGTPRELYDSPADHFVAEFVGTLNVLNVQVDEVRDGHAVVNVEESGRISIIIDGDMSAGRTVRVAIRPERIVPTPIDSWVETASDCHLRGTITSIDYLGPITQYLIETDVLGELTSRRMSEVDSSGFVVGSRVVATWAPESASVDAWPSEDP